MDIQDAAVTGMRGASEPYATLLARMALQRYAATWSFSETGATGPTGYRYGDAAGHTCIAVPDRSSARLHKLPDLRPALVRSSRGDAILRYSHSLGPS
jgi:nicotinamide mononucleotide (NMN) deamidase PncC